MVNTALHETFHKIFHKQAGDSIDVGEHVGLVFESYPEEWEPRYLRAQILRTLQAAFESPARLSAVAYWANRLSDTYPDDVEKTRSADLTEGTAQYVGSLGLALTFVGCDASETELIDLAKAVIDDGKPLVEREPTGRGLESYEIGALSGLLLEMLRVWDWQERAEKGEPPMAILLSGVTQVEEQSDDSMLQQKYQTFYEGRNAALRMLTTEFMNRVQSSSYTTLAIPPNWWDASFRVQGIVGMSVGDQPASLFAGFEGEFRDPTGAGMLTISGQDILNGVKVGDRFYSLVPVLASSFKVQSDGATSIATRNLSASGLRVVPMKIDGVGTVMLVE